MPRFIIWYCHFNLTVWTLAWLNISSLPGGHGVSTISSIMKLFCLKLTFWPGCGSKGEKKSSNTVQKILVYSFVCKLKSWPERGLDGKLGWSQRGKKKGQFILWRPSMFTAKSYPFSGNLVAGQKSADSAEMLYFSFGTGQMVTGLQKHDLFLWMLIQPPALAHFSCGLPQGSVLGPLIHFLLILFHRNATLHFTAECSLFLPTQLNS